MCGKRICCGFLFLCLAAGTAQAQQLQLTRGVTGSVVEGSTAPALGEFNIVAVMAEFQPDTSRFTTGDGTFSGTLFKDGLAASIDPLPHDEAYFQAHLDFLANYVSTVSDQKTSVSTFLVPEVVRVSQTMDAYSPIGPESDSDAEVAKLAAFIDEVWAQADLISSLDVSQLDPERTAFLIFHAGVGRDIELIGTTLDKTPFDIPSLYFSEEALTRLRPNQRPQFNGMVVTSSMIIPRTESRVGEDFINDTSFLAEFSINGLLAASFLNYLGVPDLFDTENGTSVIGPFGLMDPLGIFAYNGLLPPEPSAWTKTLLGWSDAVSVNTDIPIELKAAGSAGSSDIARVEISSSEYFLVENRNRDPEGDGLRLQVLVEGQLTEQVIQFDDESFNSTTVEGFQGVLVGADNYDWALPGGADSDGVNREGGILIWHIDEGVIRERQASNAINTDRSRPGVDLEEADGADDLGFPQSNPFAPAFDLGTPFDYFYAGNPVTVITAAGTEVALYENRFASDTYPNSNNNFGGPSFVELSDFSVPGATMSFVYSKEESSTVHLKDSFQSPLLRAQSNRGGWLSIVGPADQQAQRLAVQYPDAGGVDLLDAQTGALVASYPSGISSVNPDGDLAIVSVASDDELHLTVAGSTGETQVSMGLPVVATGATLTAPLVSLSGGRFAVRFQTETNEGVLILDGSAAFVHSPEISVGQITGIAASNDGIIVVGKEGIDVPDVSLDRSLDFAGNPGPASVGLDASGYVAVAVDVDGAVLHIDAPDVPGRAIDLTQKLAIGDSAIINPYPLLIDLDSDGHLEVLLTAGEMLVAFTKTGAVMDGFPLRTDAASVSRPLVARSADGRTVVLTADVDGYLRSYSRGPGETKWILDEGYPLSIGTGMLSTPAITASSFYSLADDGTLKAFDRSLQTAVVSGHHWLDRSGANYAFSDDINPDPSSGLLDPSETYNWPNPVRDGITNFRVAVNEPSTVQILVIDKAGNEIETIEMGAIPTGVPTEIEWQADVASGIYYARVKAVGNSGKAAERIIKVAVIR